MDELLSMKFFDSAAVSIGNKLKFTIDKERRRKKERKKRIFCDWNFTCRLSQSFSSKLKLKSIRSGEATSSDNHTDSKSVKMETGNQINEYGRVEISKNISSEEITSIRGDRFSFLT